MTKEQLIQITLKQLIESFKISPENFRLEDSEIAQTNGSFPGPTIIWQFKVESKPGLYMQDPLNATRTIMVSYNKIAKQLTCYIFYREINSLSHTVTPEAQSMVQYSDFLPCSWYSTYRQFSFLRDKLVTKRREKEYMEYLKKLHSIFPTTGDEELFK